MTRTFIALLLLSSCTAQADAPTLSFEQEGRIIHFVEMKCQLDEAACAKLCGDQFASDDTDIDTTLHHQACIDAARDKFNVAGGEA